MAFFDFTLNGHDYSNNPASGLPYGYKFISYEYIPALGNLGTDLSVVATAVGTDKDAAQASAEAAAISEGNANDSASDANAAAIAAASAAAGLQGTSTTSRSIGTGSKVFTTQSGKQFNNTYILATDAADINNWMLGYATYSGTTLSIEVAAGDTGGTGTHTSWLLSVCGPRGLVGAPGATGAIGSLQTASDFAYDVATTTGLTIGIKAGDLRADNVTTHIAASTTALTNNTTNYVQANASGVTANTVGFTAGYFPIATVVTSAGAITAVTDKRGIAVLISGANAGGVTETTISADLVLTSSSTKVQRVTPTLAGLRVKYPAANTMPNASLGVDTLRVENAGPFMVRVVDGSDNTLAVLGAGQKLSSDLLNNASVKGYWSQHNISSDGSTLGKFFNGSATQVEAVAMGNSDGRSVVCSLTPDEFLLAYQDQPNTRGRIFLVTLTGTVPAYSGVYNFYTANSPIALAMVRMSNTQAIILFNDAGGKAKTINVAAGVVTGGADRNYAGVAVNVQSIDRLTATTAVALYNDGSNNLSTRVLTVSGTSITESNPGAVEAATATGYQKVVALSSTAAVVTYQLNSSGFLWGGVINASPNPPTISGKVAMNAVASTYVTSASLYDGSGLIISYVAAASSIKSFYTSVSGSTFTPGEEKTIRTGGCTALDAATVNGRTASLVYANPSAYLEQITLSVNPSETTVRYTDPNLVQSINSSTSLRTAVSSSGKQLSVYRNLVTFYANAVANEILV